MGIGLQRCIPVISCHARDCEFCGSELTFLGERIDTLEVSIERRRPSFSVAVPERVQRSAVN